MLAIVLALAVAEPCTGPEYRALDFWIGEWEVTDLATGEPVAHSSVKASADGCWIDENFVNKTPGALSHYTGRNMTKRMPRDGAWRQGHDGPTGQVEMLVGKIENARMDLVATLGRDRVRIVLERLPDGTLRQTGWQSSDFGKSFAAAPAFDYSYRPAKP